MKSASIAGPKWQKNAGMSGVAYVEGVKNSTKDQSAAAIAAKAIYVQALQESFTRDSYSKGLSKSGKQGFIDGVVQKGSANYPTGVGAAKSLSRYTTNSAKFDSARGAAESLARGPAGSPQNLQRVAAVTQAEHAIKISG